MRIEKGDSGGSGPWRIGRRDFVRIGLAASAGTLSVSASAADIAPPPWAARRDSILPLDNLL